MSQDEQAPARLRWARLRFSIIGQLLASPPEPGELSRRIDELAGRSWKHPTTGEGLRFSSKTIVSPRPDPSDQLRQAGYTARA